MVMHKDRLKCSIQKEKGFQSKRRALKGDKIYLHDNLIQLNQQTVKINMTCSIQERRENGSYIEMVMSLIQ